MSEAIKRRRGTTAEHASFTGLEGEITVDTTNKVVVVHDGVTPGGVPMARADETGDMFAATYDPQNKQADAFDRSNHTGEINVTNVAGAKVIDGREYLWAYHQKIKGGGAAKVILSGDSTTSGANASAPYVPSTLLASLAARKNVFRQTVVNAGHSGDTTADWDATYVTTDMAADPDLYIVRWGINDPVVDLMTPGDFETALRSGLTKVRAHANGSIDVCSVVLMMPNAIDEDGTARNPAWLESIRPIVRQAAADFHCVFFDTYEMFRDALTGRGRWLDTPYTVHPGDIMNSWIIGALADVIWPVGVDQSGIAASPVAASGFTADTTAPAVYRQGDNVSGTGGYSVASGIVASLTVICTLPEGYRPRSAYESIVLSMFNTGNSFAELVPGQVLADGTVRTLKATSAAVNRAFLGVMRFRA